MPTTSTQPFCKGVAVCRLRATVMVAAAVQVPVVDVLDAVAGAAPTGAGPRRRWLARAGRTRSSR